MAVLRIAQAAQRTNHAKPRNWPEAGGVGEHVSMALPKKVRYNYFTTIKAVSGCILDVPFVEHVVDV
jgi:hypothetical protein